MTELIKRVHTALGSEWKPDRSPWEGLMRLYAVDADAFYLLAYDGVKPTEPLHTLAQLGEPADSVVGPIAALAQRVRRAVRVSYRLTPPTGDEGQVVTPNDKIAVPADLFPHVRQFLMALDDKGVSERPGKDYEGEAVSEAEVCFKLGSSTEWNQDPKQLQARKEARPQVFRVNQQDLDSLKTQPAYVTHNLFKCARKVILAPTAIYRDLQRGEGTLKRLRNGWAICGKPNRACDEDGNLIPVPADMVFMVYADSEGCVFDWDWVEEDRHQPGHPVDGFSRFGDPVPVGAEMMLELPPNPPEGAFDPAVATYSARGDCIFCYVCDACGYADRINPDLTVFRSFESKEVAGFKIKNVRRILRDEENFVSDAAPDLKVTVRPFLHAILKTNFKTSVFIYDLIIEAFSHKGIRPPAVEPRPEMSEAEAELAEV